MPQIPYSPVPSVAPSEAATPSFHLNVPEGAFGGGVAAATEGLGAKTSAVGNELWGRAVALKQLDNEAEARDADTKYMMTAGQLHADYSALQGADAKAAFPKYQTDLAEARTKLRDGLSNPMAQKMFDSSSLSTMGRSIFNGAGHAASEFKQYTIGTAVAQMGVDAKTASDNPNDEGLFQEKLTRTKENASHVAALKGAPAGSPQEQLTTLTATSNLWAQRIIGKAKNGDPFEAAKYLDDNRTKLTEQDRLRVEGIVRGEGRAQGSNRIANEVYKPDATLASLEAAAEKRAKELAPEDPVLAQHAVAAIKGKYNQDKYAGKQQKDDDVQAYKEAVAQGSTGQGVKTELELRQMPGMTEVIERLPPSVRNDIPGYINRFNKQRDQATNDESKLRLNGLFSNPDTREEALNLDLTKEKLSVGDMMRFQDKQVKLRKDLEGDPRVSRAVGWMQQGMGAQLEALGVYKRTDANKDLYDKFRGSVQVGIDSFIEDNKRPPNYKEFMDQIAPRLLQTRDTSMIFGKLWPTETPFFDQSNDVKFERFGTRMKADFAAKQLGPPSDAEIYKAYVRSLYTKDYGKKDKAP